MSSYPAQHSAIAQLPCSPHAELKVMAYAMRKPLLLNELLNSCLNSAESQVPSLLTRLAIPFGFWQTLSPAGVFPEEEFRAEFLPVLANMQGKLQLMP